MSLCEVLRLNTVLLKILMFGQPENNPNGLRVVRTARTLDAINAARAVEATLSNGNTGEWRIYLQRMIEQLEREAGRPEFE